MRGGTHSQSWLRDDRINLLNSHERVSDLVLLSFAGKSSLLVSWTF